jgi:hypothetical protein
MSLDESAVLTERRYGWEYLVPWLDDRPRAVATRRVQPEHGQRGFEGQDCGKRHNRVSHVPKREEVATVAGQPAEGVLHGLRKYSNCV